MKDRQLKHQYLILAIVLFVAVSVVSMAEAEIRADYMYNLTDFNGYKSYKWAKLSVDKQENEVYVVNTRKNNVRIFGKSGMEIYRFGEEGALGNIIDIASFKDGNMLLLSKDRTDYKVIRLNFRGEPVSEIVIDNLPPEFSEFRPERIFYIEGKLYLADIFSMKVAVTDVNGIFQAGYDVASILDIEDEKRDETSMVGFSADREGNMFFTVPVLFMAFRLTPELKLTGFGIPGGGPGKFGIVAGIAVDDRGYVYVADRIRCVILVFDKNLKFQTEFGYRGYRPRNLIGPAEIAFDSRGRLYVTQLRNRGISVFNITYNKPITDTGHPAPVFKGGDERGGGINTLSNKEVEIAGLAGKIVSSEKGKPVER